MESKIALSQKTINFFLYRYNGYLDNTLLTETNRPICKAGRKKIKL